MADRYIYLSTTPTIPAQKDRVVINSHFIWAQHQSVTVAMAEVTDWVRENNWDAIVGLHVSAGTGTIVVFGTAILWQK
jgi:hypothetical protein